ncbi:stage V sporulation protein S [bacterium]|nr:stage V sporulation protein S [bacterium]
MIVIRVASRSLVAGVAGAVAGCVREHRRAEVQAIGAAAINQAIKAITLARQYLIEEGTNLVMIPSFVDVQIHGMTRTAVRISVVPAEDVHSIPVTVQQIS